MCARVRNILPPPHFLSHVLHGDQPETLQSTGHFFCQPPRPKGLFLRGRVSSHGTEHSPGTQADTPQSTIFSGGNTLLNFMTLARTFR